ncbi:MAG: hypothetical protein IJH50_07765 [Kiritimatiellae bacterium]|nr:hypothetical protein [Kiritimatiellia bacterium]
MIAVAVVLAGWLVLAESASVPPPFDETAVPVEKRQEVAIALKAKIQACHRNADQIDAAIASAFGGTNVDELVRFCIDRRRFLRNRAIGFAEAELSRGDVDGLCFAAQSLADAEEVNGLIEESLACWRDAPRPENRPIVLNVRDFGARGDGSGDDSAAFARACEAVRALGGKPSVLRIPSGKYRLNTPRTLKPMKLWNGASCGDPWVLHGYCVFDSLANCRIEGDGPTNTFLVTGLRDRPFMLLNCRNCKVSGFDLSLERLPYIEGVLEEYDPKTFTGVVRLAPGSLTPDDESWTPNRFEKSSNRECFGALFDEKGQFIRDVAFLNWGPERHYEKLDDGRWKLSFNGKTYRSCLESARAGHRIVIPNRANSHGAMHIAFSFHCTVEDVWVRTSRSSAFNGLRSRGTVYCRCRDFPPDGHLLASNADACFTPPGSILVGCQFESMCDDGFNARTYAIPVKRTDRPDEIVRRDGGPIRTGSVASFADSWTAQYLGLGTVGSESEPFYRPDGWYRTVRFTSPLPAKATDGQFLYFPRQFGVGTIVSGCTIRNGRLAGLVLQSPCLLVENCSFGHIRDSSIRLGALGDYMEGPPPYNALIRNCRFSDCGTGISSWIRMCDKTKTKWSKDLASPMRGIEIDGCKFDARVMTQVSLRNATQK